MKKMFFWAVVQLHASWLWKGDVKANQALIQQDQHRLYLTRMQSWILDSFYGIQYTYTPAHKFLLLFTIIGMFILTSSAYTSPTTKI